jgi:hypothetical protein
MKFRSLFIGLGEFGAKIASDNYSQLILENPTFSKVNSVLTLSKNLSIRNGVEEVKSFDSFDFKEDDYKNNLNVLKETKAVEDAIKNTIDHISTAANVQQLIANGHDIEPNKYRVLIYFSMGDDISSIAISHILKLIGRHRVIETLQVYLICLDYELMEEKYERAYACLCELDYHISDMDYVVSFSMLSKYGSDNFGGFEKEDLVPLIYSLSKSILYDQIDGLTSSAIQTHRLNSNQRVIYNSCGFASLRYDKNQVWQKICDHEKNNYLSKLINTIATTQIHRSSITGPVNQFVRNKSLDYIHKVLKSGQDGNSLLIDIKQKIHTKLQEYPTVNAESYFKILLDVDRDYANNTWQEITPKIAANIDKVTQQYHASLNEEIDNISNTEEQFSGLVRLRAFLNTLLQNDDANIDGVLIDDDNSFNDLENNQLIYFKKLYNKVPQDKRDPIARQILFKSDLKEKRKAIVNCEQKIDNIRSSIVDLDKSYLQKNKDIEVVGYEDGYFKIGGQKINIDGFLLEDFSDFSDVYSSPEKNNQKNNSVDLRRYLSKDIENQGEVGSCVTNAITSALEYISHRATGKFFQMSRMFLYYNARLYDSSNKEIQGDEGCSILNALRSAQETGVCLEHSWPYEESKMNVKPTASAYVEAEKYKVDKFQLITNNLNDMISCLDEGYPFVFGLKLTKSFNQIGGIIKTPDASEESIGKHSNHAMLCVGYDKKEKFFIVRNSWGEEWGDSGYCYIPFDYMNHPDYMLGAFTIRSVDEKVNEIIKKNIWGDELGFFKDGSHNQIAVAELETQLKEESNKYEKLKNEYDKTYSILEKQDQLFKQISFRNKIQEKLKSDNSLEISNKCNDIRANEIELKDISQNISNLNDQLRWFLYKYIGAPIVGFIVLLLVLYFTPFVSIASFLTSLAIDFVNILPMIILKGFSTSGFLLIIWLIYGLCHYFFHYYLSFKSLEKLRKKIRYKDKNDRENLKQLYDDKWNLEFNYHLYTITYEDILPPLKRFINRYLKGLSEFISLIHNYREEVASSYKEVSLKETIFCQRIFPLNDHKDIEKLYQSDQNNNLRLTEDVFTLNHNMIKYIQAHIDGSHLFKDEVELFFNNRKNRYITDYSLSNLISDNCFNIKHKVDNWTEFLERYSSPLIAANDLRPDLKIVATNYVLSSNTGFEPFLISLRNEISDLKVEPNEDDDELLVYRYVKSFPAYYIESFKHEVEDDVLKNFYIYDDVPKFNRN